MLKHFFLSALSHYAKAPLTTLVNTVALALGIACFFGALGVSSYWGQSDASFENRDRIRLITQQFVSEDGDMRDNPMVAEPVAKYIREDVPELEAVARVTASDPATFLVDGEPFRVETALANTELFDIFDFEFTHGSVASIQENPGSLVLMNSVSERLFGAENPVGKSVQFGEDFIPVSAVILDPPQPSHFGTSDQSIRSFEVLQVVPAASEDPQEWWLGVSNFTYVLLPEENTVAAERALNSALSDFSERRIPEEQRAALIRLWFGTMTLEDVQVKVLDGQIFKDNRSALSVTNILFGMGVLILIVSIINYSNLATAQAAGYAKEVGMRKVVGASQGSIALQYWLEAFILTLLGFVLAAVLIVLTAPVLKAQAGIDLMAGLERNQYLPVWAVGLAFIVSVLASIYPVAYLSRIRPVEALRSGKVRGGNRRLTEVLVGIQFAAASALLILVLVVGQQNAHMRNLVLSPDEDPVVVLEGLAVDGDHSDDYRAMLDQYPSLKSISHIGYMPWSDYRNMMNTSPTREADGIEATSTRSDIGYDFFDTYGAKLLAGRLYDPERDRYWQAYPEDYTGDFPTVIDATYAEALGYASPEEAVGQPLYMTRQAVRTFDWDPTFRIIGVVETVPLVYGIGNIRSNFYALARYSGEMNLMIRIDRNRVQEGIEAIETMVKSRDPNAVVNLRFTDDEFERNFQTYQGINVGFMGLSLIAFAISTIGLFAMAVFTTLQRRHEIGVRKTLGASTGGVTLQLVKEFTWPVLIANLIAWPIAYYAATLYLHNFMQRMSLTLLPWIIGLVVTLLIAWVAVGGQAFKAARVKPAEVLKSE